jgi:hypothetical protein
MSASHGIDKAEAASEADFASREAWSPPRAPGGPPLSIVAERPIFLAEGPWRRRAVAAATAAVGALLLVWLVAIVAGALGFGPLGSLPLLGAGRSDHSAGSPAVGAESIRATPSRLGPRAGDRSAGAEGTATAAKAPRSPAPTGAGGDGGTRSHPGTGVAATTRTPAATPGREKTSSSPTAAGEAPAAESPGAASSPPAGAAHRPTVTPSGHEVPAVGSGESASRSPVPEGGAGKAETGMATKPG